MDGALGFSPDESLPLRIKAVSCVSYLLFCFESNTDLHLKGVWLVNYMAVVASENVTEILFLTYNMERDSQTHFTGMSDL